MWLWWRVRISVSVFTITHHDFSYADIDTHAYVACMHACLIHLPLQAQHAHARTHIMCARACMDRHHCHRNIIRHAHHTFASFCAATAQDLAPHSPAGSKKLHKASCRPCVSPTTNRGKKPVPPSSHFHSPADVNCAFRFSEFTPPLPLH